MTRTTLLMALILGLGARASGEEEAAPDAAHGIHWEASLEKALEEAADQKKPLLVDFEADWCGWCKKLDRETYGDERVIRFVHDRFIAVKVDTDDHPEIAGKYGVGGLPTILVLSPSGDELARFTGFREPEQLLEELSQAAGSAGAIAELRAKAEAEPDNIDLQRAYARALFAAGDAAGAAAVLEKVLEKEPEHSGLLLDLADIQRGARKLKEARKTYESILGLPGEAAAADKAKARLPLATILIAQKDHRAAIDVLSRLIAGAEGNEGGKDLWEAYFLRSYAYATLKDAEKALADLEAVREKDQEGPWGLRASYIIDIVEPR